jgi:diguanylate cyclase (GGDEF)-like protein
MMRLFRSGIRVKLILFFLLVSLFPVGFLGWQAYNEQKRVIQEEVSRSHLELSNTLAGGIYQNLEYTRRLITSISELNVIKNLDARVAEDFFQALLRQFHFFKLIYLVNEKREIVASTDPSVRLPPNWSFTGAKKRAYQGSLSEVHPLADGKPHMTLEAIITSPQKGLTGVLIAEVDLTYVQELMKTALKRSKSQGLVFDEKGVIIAQSTSKMATFGISTAEVLDKDITGVRDALGERYLITAVSLKKFDFYQAPNWTILLQVPEREAFAAAFRLRDHIMSLLGVTAGISLLLAVLIGNSFIAPLLHLIDGARHIGQGDFSQQILPKSSDEIGTLTKTFDEMRVNLKNTKEDLDHRIVQLTTLHEVGKAISSTLDFLALQNLILETVVKVIQAEKGSLMLVDESEKILTIGTAIGLSDEIKREAKVGMGEPISGWVMESGRPLFVADVETDHTFLAIKKDHITRGTLMSVPLKAKDKFVGVLNVSKGQPNSFRQKDFELFQNLANQAAIAIENARLYRYAVTDEMTRLYNHRYFQQRLDEELIRADRYDNQVSLIILDVDHFKKFNDTYGHPEGDRVLKTVSRLIEKSVREVDIPARYGGEEFVVICPEKDGEGTMVPANRIRSTIEGFDFRINGNRVPITVSLGIANYPHQARSKADLIMMADTALYHSKESGRNLASLFTPEMKADEAQQKREEKKKQQAK